MADLAICAQAVTRVFDDTPALEDISFGLGYRQIGALVGPNGSGKSTLMRLLVGLLRPTRGTLRVLGLEPFAQAELMRPRVTVLLERPRDYGSLSVLESLQQAGEDAALAPEAAHQQTLARAARIDELLYRFDLWPQRHCRVHDLSASARAKLAVVATLVPQAALLLLDEPLAALDAGHRLHTLSIVRDVIQKDAATALFTTHMLTDAEAIADEIFILAHGQMVAAGAAQGEPLLPTLEITGRGLNEEIVALVERRPEVESVQSLPQRLIIHLRSHADTAPLVSLLVESGVDIDEVHKRRWTRPIAHLRAGAQDT